jgi:hypothetical protein
MKLSKKRKWVFAYEILSSLLPEKKKRPTAGGPGVL